VNILLADDEPDILKIINTFLTGEGMNVFMATDGDKALEILHSNKIDLAILDWMMPCKDGMEVCKEIKDLNSDTKVIILTAKTHIENELDALYSGADEYIRKPFDPRVVVLRAKKLLNCDDIYKTGREANNRRVEGRRESNSYKSCDRQK
jgi:DNA-binding response OmpR family regulator